MTSASLPKRGSDKLSNQGDNMLKEIKIIIYSNKYFYLGNEVDKIAEIKVKKMMQF